MSVEVSQVTVVTLILKIVKVIFDIVASKIYQIMKHTLDLYVWIEVHTTEIVEWIFDIQISNVVYVVMGLKVIKRVSISARSTFHARQEVCRHI